MKIRTLSCLKIFITISFSLVLFLTGTGLLSALSSVDVTQLNEALELEKNPEKRAKILLILIKTSQEKLDNQQELLFREQLSQNIFDLEAFRSITFANQYRIGTLYFITDQFEKSFSLFKTLLGSLPLNDTENRYLVLSHLIAISETLGDTQAQEKYLSLYVVAKGTTSEFYKSYGGFNELLKLTLTNQSENSHIYFEKWAEIAENNDLDADKKAILNQWVNYTIEKPEHFLDKPFNKYIAFLQEQQLIEETLELMKLHAEHQPDTSKKIKTYEAIFKYQTDNNKKPDIGILTFLLQHYQKTDNKPKALIVLTELANRSDYHQQSSALKSVAALALKADNWLLSFQTHEQLFQLTVDLSANDSLLILNNLIFLAKKLSKDEAYIQYLGMKVFNTEIQIPTQERIRSLNTLMHFHQDNQNSDTALQQHKKFLVQFPEITKFYEFYVIHYLAAIIAENKQDFKLAFRYHNSAIKLGENKSQVPEEIVKIILKTLQIAEKYIDDDTEIQVINQLIIIYNKNQDTNNEARYRLILAQKYQNLGNNEQAVISYQLALKKYRILDNQPRVSQILTALTNLQGDDSEQRLIQLLNLEKSMIDSENKNELVKIRLEIGNTYKLSNQIDNAKTFYLKAFNTKLSNKNHSSAQAGYFAALIDIQNQRYEQANQILDEILNQYAFTASEMDFKSNCMLAKSQILNTSGQYADALKVIDKILAFDQKTKIYLTKGIILMGMGEFSPAITILNQALNVAQTYVEKLNIHIQLAKSYSALKQFDKTLAHIDTGFSFTQENTPIKKQFDLSQLKSQSLFKKGDKATGLQNQIELVKLLESNLNSNLLTIANLNLSNFYLEIGQVDNALKAINLAKIEKDTDTTVIIRILLNQAKINRTLNKLEISLDFLINIDQYISPTISNQLLAEVYYQRGFTLNQYTDYDEAIRYFTKSEAFYKKAENNSDAILAKLAQANVLMKQGKIGKSEFIFKSLLTKTIDDHLLQADIFASLALLYTDLGQYTKALDSSVNAEEKLKLATSINRLPEIFNARGIIFLQMKDYDQAEILLIKALKENAKYKNPLLDSELENNLGGLYKEKGDFEKARVHLIKSGELQKSLGFESLLALTFNNIGSVYLEENKYKEALEFLRQSRSFAKKFNLKKELAVSWNNEGILFFKQQDFPAAKKAFQEALSLQKVLNLRIDIARTLNNLSIIASNNKATEKALELSQQAIASLSLKDLQQNVFYANPPETSVLAPNLMKDFLQNKGAFLRTIANRSEESTTKIKYLDAAYLSFELSINLIENLRTQIKSAKSQQLLMQSNIDIYQQLIAILFELGNLTDNQNYHKKAFFFAEKSRARSFLDQLQEQAARASLKLPAEIQERENTLKSKVSVLDANIFNELSKPEKQRNTLKVEQWQIEKTDIQIQYTKLTQELEKNYPSYASLKYPKVYGTQEVTRQLLDAKNQVIVYFLGIDVSYGWQISKHSFKMISLPPMADIDKLIRKYRTTLVDPLIFQDPDDDEFVIDLTNTHLVTGLQIYRTFLQPLIGDADPDIDNLLIIPDGVLYYLPFETILVKLHPKTNQQYLKGREYLLNQYSVYYSPSTSVLGMIKNQISQRDQDEMAKRKTFIGFGDPQYKPKRTQVEGFTFNPTLDQLGFYKLTRLFNTLDELENISGMFPNDATSYLRDEAKETYAKKNLFGYKYVHFATHGIMDEVNPQFSGVVLNLVNTSPPNDGFLQASEIFDLELNADLVTLSACETGLGKVIKGEGMVGLTRAFLFAGSPSIVVSLWTVADESTSKLMIHFYKFLKQGFSKNESLRQAKIELMQTENPEDEDELIYNDPFFWGPFILNGLK